MRPAILLLAATFAPTVAQLGAQQVADTTFRPEIRTPAFAPGRGPVVFLDEAHVNFHTVAGRYAPFVRLLERDGFVVRPNRSPFSRRVLDSARVLVIANALAKVNATNWSLPTPSAFEPDEIRAQLGRCGLAALEVRPVSDRHVLVTGNLPSG